MPARNLMKMKRERAELVTKMRSMVDAAETRSEKKFTDEETRQYNEYQTELDRRDADILIEERLQAAEAGTAGNGNQEENTGEFRSFGEYLHELRFNPGSSRISFRGVNGDEARDVTMGNGASMGAIVPSQFSTVISMVEPGDAVVRPRAMVIPAGDPPDSSFSMPALDQTGSKGVYGGVVVKWISENSERKDAGDPSIYLIKLEPQEVSAYIDISDKLLRNSAASGALVQNLLRVAILGAEDDKFINGLGTGTPLGYLASKAALKVNRTTAGSIVYDDVVNMLAIAKFGKNLVWNASQTTLPKLMKLKDEANQLIWQTSARDGIPGTLLGYPVLFNDMSPTVANEGCLSLCNMDYYAIKDGSPLAIFIDPYTQKVNGLTRIYAFWNVDGQPRIKSPLLTRDGATKVSPFIVLK